MIESLAREREQDLAAAARWTGAAVAARAAARRPPCAVGRGGGVGRRTPGLERPAVASGVAAGARLAAPLVPAILLNGVAFAALARAAGLDALPALALSAAAFSGSAQFAAVSLLGAGAGFGAAVLTGLLVNTRSVPPRVPAVLELLGPALLAGLVATGLLGGDDLRPDARLAGVAAGALALRARLPLAVALLAAALVTAAARAAAPFK